MCCVCVCVCTNKVKDNVSAAQDFYSVVFEAHVVAAALSHFSMSSVDSGIEIADDPTKFRGFMMRIIGTLVDEHVLKFTETTTTRGFYSTTNHKNVLKKVTVGD